MGFAARVASAMSLCAVAFSVQAERLPIEVLSAVVGQKIADARVLLQRNGAPERGAWAVPARRPGHADQ